MMDRLMIVEDSLESVDGGFAFLGRLPYYRGLGLSMVENIEVSVDGEVLPREAIRLSVRGKTYTLDEVGQAALTWNAVRAQGVEMNALPVAGVRELGK